MQIEHAYCRIPYVSKLTVLCAGDDCFDDHELYCHKTRARRVPKNLFHRFQSCENPYALHLSNDDDLMLSRWALDTMVVPPFLHTHHHRLTARQVAYAADNPQSIVGPCVSDLTGVRARLIRLAGTVALLILGPSSRTLTPGTRSGRTLL